jgi:phosphatidylinositol alpha-1,6-mannosyltransferase
LQALPLLPRQDSYHLYISESLENETKKSEYISFLDTNGISQNVTFLGHLAYKDLPAVYRSCDIYCFTGSPDSTGATAASLSVLEAQASGLAVVRSIGNSDEVLPGKTGLIVDPRDKKALAIALHSLIDDKNLLNQLKGNGPKHIMSNYTWEKVCQKIIYGLTLNP